jgi:hypothetical protein
VNAAFLLVTTAWLTGADPVPVQAAPAMKPAPAAAAPGAMAAPAAPMVAGPGCGDCGSGASECCESAGHRFRERFKGLFACHKSCGSCETCAPAPKPCCAPAPAPKPCCEAPAPTCHEGCGQRLRGLFHRKSCCETVATCGGCDGCGAAPMVAPAPRPEPIPAPGTPAKKMPNTKTTQNFAPESVPVPDSTPALETAPAVVPNVPADTDRKEPF